MRPSGQIVDLEELLISAYSFQTQRFPNWVGGNQKRHFELSGDELVLRTPPMKIGGEEIQNELRWVREE